MSNFHPLAGQVAIAVEHHRQGRLAEALAAYNDILRIQPAMAQVHRNRGEVLHRLGHAEEALRSLECAIRLQPDFTEGHYGLGVVLYDLRRNEDALRSFDRVLEFKPDHVNALIYRGNLLRDSRDHARAMDAYDTAVRINAQSAFAWCNRGILLNEMRRPDEALASFDHAIALAPSMLDAIFNKGHALRNLQEFEQALACYGRAIELNPAFADAFNCKGITLQAMARFDEALQSFDRALALQPDFPAAAWNKSTCLLLLERFEEGWPLHEARKPLFGTGDFPEYPQPVWRGEDIRGKTLLLYFEQGFGDTIQFFRYADMVARPGVTVIVRVQDELVRLLKSSGADAQVIPFSAPLPGFDFHCPLMSLPLLCGTERSSIQAAVPYLRADPERVEMWRKRIGSDGFRIGVCWQGNRQAAIDAGRSFAPSFLDMIAAIPGVRLISLQKGESSAETWIETLGDDFDAGPDAFMDSAAVIETLDLVITADTAMAHLAGALGRPVWTALRHVPDWRWGLNGDASIWYPSMRLFRQPMRGDWTSVFNMMAVRLRAETRSR